MGTLLKSALAPKNQISQKAIPKPIRDSILHIFANCGDNVWLVGGTALAGYYAEHRRSDDIDLFVSNSPAHYAAVLAVKSLKKIGVHFLNESQTPNYYRSDMVFHDHSFTTDVVLDENIHKIGGSAITQDKVCVADISTLFAMKIACLVSRCSEKDLFDLDWLFSHIEKLTIADLVKLGSQIDSGLSVETLIISLQGAVLRKDSCHFLLSDSDITVDQAYQNILKLRKELVHALLGYEKTSPLSDDAKTLKSAVKNMRKIDKR